jgi:hypothetical protein
MMPRDRDYTKRALHDAATILRGRALSFEERAILVHMDTSTLIVQHVKLSRTAARALSLFNQLSILINRLHSARCSRRTARRKTRVTAHRHGRDGMGIARNH